MLAKEGTVNPDEAFGPEAIRKVLDYPIKYAIAPFAVLRTTDFRSDLLGRFCVLGAA